MPLDSVGLSGGGACRMASGVAEDDAIRSRHGAKSAFDESSCNISVRVGGMTC